MAIGHQSPQSSLPPLSQKQVNTTTWGAGGNTKTIIDAYIHPNSVVFAFTTGAVPRNGSDWAYTITQGQVIITSTDGESSTLPIAYIVL